VTKEFHYLRFRQESFRWHSSGFQSFDSNFRCAVPQAWTNISNLEKSSPDILRHVQTSVSWFISKRKFSNIRKLSKMFCLNFLSKYLGYWQKLLDEFTGKPVETCHTMGMKSYQVAMFDSTNENRLRNGLEKLSGDQLPWRERVNVKYQLFIAWKCRRRPRVCFRSECCFGRNVNSSTRREPFPCTRPTTIHGVEQIASSNYYQVFGIIRRESNPTVPSLLKPIRLRPFIWDHVHLRPRHLRQHSF